MKTLYKEKIGPQSIGISQYGTSWIVWGERENDPGSYIERCFSPNGYRDSDEAYGEAIRYFDLSCDAAARRFNTARPLPGQPNFIKAIHI